MSGNTNSEDVAEVFRRFKIWYDKASKVESIRDVAQWSFYIGVWFTIFFATGININNPLELVLSSFEKVIEHSFPLGAYIFLIIRYLVLIYGISLMAKTVLKIRKYGLKGYMISVSCFLILPLLYFSSPKILLWIGVLFIIIFYFAKI